jgi:exopolysaccharide biosynthesis polyprenyl glycosylphosphotransferase
MCASLGARRGCGRRAALGGAAVQLIGGYDREVGHVWGFGRALLARRNRPCRGRAPLRGGRNVSVEARSFTPALAPSEPPEFARAAPPVRTPASNPGLARRRGVALERDTVYRRLLALADMLAAAIALLGSISLVGPGHAGIATLATVPLIVLISKLSGTYDREDMLLHKSTLDEAAALFQVSTLYALSAWLIDGLIVTGAHGRRELLVLWISLFLLLLLCRTVARRLSRAITPPERCLVIGDQTICDRMELKFGRSQSLHAEVVGCLLLDGLPRDGSSGELDAADLHESVSLLAVDRLILAPLGSDEHELVNLVHAATLLGLKVSVLPRELEAVGSSVQLDDIEGIPLLSTRPLGLPRSSQLLKRGLDLIGSGAMLVLLAPLFLAVAVAIKLDSRGPVFFRQRRVGRDGHGFQMLKFRTMVPDAEQRKLQLVHLNEADGLFKIANDPRITRVGKWLRRSSIDELPQLLNVFGGDMSLVGPRPLIAEEDILIEGWRRRRLQLTPGMTGNWQVLGSSRIPLDEMARIDYMYVSNWSMWLDLKILLRTIPHVFAARGL